MAHGVAKARAQTLERSQAPAQRHSAAAEFDCTRLHLNGSVQLREGWLTRRRRCGCFSLATHVLAFGLQDMITQASRYAPGSAVSVGCRSQEAESAPNFKSFLSLFLPPGCGVHVAEAVVVDRVCCAI